VGHVQQVSGAAGRVPRARTARGRGRAPGEATAIGFVYLAPAAALYGLFVVLPLFDGIWTSLRSWDGITPSRYVGLQNYRDLVDDTSVRHAFTHVLVLCIFYAALPIALGLFVSASLTRVTVRGVGFVRGALFLPQVVAPVVIGVSWRWIFDEGGPVNDFLRTVGLGSLARAWLGDFTWALPAVGVVGTWVMFGLCMVLFLSGIQRIPSTLYDAARVDGAGAVREFLHVTLPGLRAELAVATTLTVIAALRAFDLIYVTTSGGPGDETLTPSYLIYTRAFQTGQVGLAAAIAVVLTAIVFAIAAVVNRLLAGREG
jgi:raffinose/stachyose/melibiose transport system permease protein